MFLRFTHVGGVDTTLGLGFHSGFPIGQLSAIGQHPFFFFQNIVMSVERQLLLLSGSKINITKYHNRFHFKEFSPYMYIQVK